MVVSNISSNNSTKVQNSFKNGKQNFAAVNSSISDGMQRQPLEDNYNGKSVNKKHLLAYASLGTAIAALAGIVIDYKFAEGKHVKKFWNRLTGHVEQKNTEPKPVRKPDATKPEPMQISEEAKAEYENKKTILNGKFYVTVNDKPNSTLKKMAWYYKQEERIASLPQLLKDFEKNIQSETVNNLWEINFKLIDEERKYIELIQKRYEKNPFTFMSNPKGKQRYDEVASSFLNKNELAEFKHIKAKIDLIRKTIQSKRDNIIKNRLRSSADKPLHCKRIKEYVTDCTQLKAFGEYYDMYPYNNALRVGRKLDASGQASIDAMDSVFKIAPALEEEAVVYRALHGHPVFKEQNAFIDSLKEGMIINDKSYISTSVDVENDQFLQFANGVVDESYGALMRIKLPKGTKGVLGGYNEYLLPRDSRIKVNKIEVIDNIKIMDCEYILS